MASRYAFTNARLAVHNKTKHNVCILVNDGVIVNITEDGPPAGMHYQEIDAGGNYLSPGFIDIHVHGGNGHDFMDATVDAFLGVSAFHAKHGTTSIVPTLCSAKPADYKKIFKAFKKAREASALENCPEMLGLYLEGPYISKEFKGAQNEQTIKEPSARIYESIVTAAAGDILIWGAAPEVPRANIFAAYLKSNGIIASIAHSAAYYKQAAEALSGDFSHITHFYNAMSGIRKVGPLKHGGVVEAGYINDDATIEIIADGIHVPECLLKLAYRIKGPGKICLVTDSTRAAGLNSSGNKNSILGDKKDGKIIVIENGAAWLEDRSVLAGSIATTDVLLKNITKMIDVPVEEAVKMLTSTPAQVAGVKQRKGMLKPGRDADLVIFDDDISIKMTMIRGRIVYENM